MKASNILKRFQKHKQPLQLKHTLTLLFVSCIILVSLLITIPSFYFYQRQLVEDISQGRVDTLSQVNSNLNATRSEMITISDMFYNNPDMQALWRTPEPSSDGAAIVAALDQSIRTTLSHYAFEYEIQLSCSNGLSYSTDPLRDGDIEEYEKEWWYYTAVHGDESLSWHTIQTASIDEVRQHDFSLLRILRSETGENLGTLIISVDEQFLHSIYGDLMTTENSSNIYLVAQSGQIISHRDKSMIGHYFYNMTAFYELFENEDSTIIYKSYVPYLFSKCTSDDAAWIVVEEIPMSTILEPLQKIEVTISLMVLIICLISILVSTKIAWWVSKPLTAVYNTMKQVRQGHDSTRFPRSGFAESRWIAEACEEFVDQNVALLQDIKETEHAKRMMELQFLQLQINPHFMHNTLFSIKCMIDMQRTEEACRMIDALNAMLKNILDSQRRTTTVGEEIDALKQYTYILQQRYVNAFSFQFIMDEDCLSFEILRFILQPIIENAAFHGFSGIQADGVISVSVSQEHEFLRIEVADNGVGMSQSTIDAIYGGQISLESGAHIGLKNIISRLELHYQKKAQFQIKSTEGQGTTVSITLPKYPT